MDFKFRYYGISKMLTQKILSASVGKVMVIDDFHHSEPNDKSYDTAKIALGHSIYGIDYANDAEVDRIIEKASTRKLKRRDREAARGITDLHNYFFNQSIFSQILFRPEWKVPQHLKSRF